MPVFYYFLGQRKCFKGFSEQLSHETMLPGDTYNGRFCVFFKPTGEVILITKTRNGILETAEQTFNYPAT